MKLPKLLVSLLLLTPFVLFFACGEEDQPCPCANYCNEEGMILGIDLRKCGCCGGWFIEIEGDTLRAPTLPETFTANLDPNEFPLPVYLEWEHDDTPCLGDEIDVECIKRQ